MNDWLRPHDPDEVFVGSLIYLFIDSRLQPRRVVRKTSTFFEAEASVPRPGKEAKVRHAYPDPGSLDWALRRLGGN